MKSIELPTITVATPTYNRGYCISGVFESLCAQTTRNFEWIIVDDGSTDNTETIVSEFIKKSDFKITYLKQKNQGKHSAINNALKNANGDLFLIFDSDDKCYEDSLEFMSTKWVELSIQVNHLAGITTLSHTPDGDIIGTKFPKDGDIKNLQTYYEENCITGDKWDIHSTEILRSHPFPEEEGQKFCPESLIWNRISQNYLTAFYNKPTKIAEYLEDGLSKNRISLLVKYPRFYCLYYNELYNFSKFRRTKIRAASNFVRASLHANTINTEIKRNIIIFILGAPIGIVAYIIDKLNYRNSLLRK